MKFKTDCCFNLTSFSFSKTRFITLILWCTLVFIDICVYAQTSYTWNGSASSVWTNTSNWTPSTGFPGATDHVIVNSGTPNSLQLDINRSIQNFTINGGNFDLNGLNLTINGNAIVNAGNINNGNISVTAATTSTFGSSSGSPVIGTTINVISATITVRNTTFNNTVYLQKTGTSNDLWVGNNSFNQATHLRLSGSGYIRHSNTTRDIFNADLTLTNNGSGILNMAYNHATGTQFNGNIILNNTSSGGIRFGQSTGTCVLAATKTLSIGGSGYSSSGGLYFRNFTQTGVTAQNLTLTGTAPLYLQSGTNFNGPVSFIAAQLYLNGSTFHQNATLTKTGATANPGTGGNTFHGDLTLTNSGTGYLQTNGTGNDVYNGNIIINNTNTGGIRFGQSTGTCQLAASKTISIGGSGYSSSGALYIRNFTQVGTTAQSMTLTGTAILYLQTGNAFNGPVNFTAAQLMLNGSTFNNTATLTKSGATNNIGIGGNTFNNDLTLTNTGTGYLQVNSTSNDIYNGNIILNNTNTGGLRFGQSTGTCALATSKTISVGGTGYTSSGALYLRNFTQIGTTPQTLTLAGTAALYLQTGNTFNGNVTFTAAQIYLNGSRYNGTAAITKTGAGDNAGTGGNRFEQDVVFTNTGGGFLQTNGAAGDTFNGNIVLNSTSSGGIRFGQGNGYCILESTKTISIGGSGFSSSGGLYLRRFLQTGAVNLSLTLTGTSRLHLEAGTVFLGEVNFTAPQIYLNGARYYNQAFIQKTGATANPGIGGNIFYQNVTVTNSGSGYLQFNGASNDTFYENIILNNTSTGGIRFGQNAGICWLPAGKTITLGVSGYISSGALYLRNFKQQGTTPQTLNLGGTAPLYLQTGSEFKANIDFKAAQLFLNGARFRSLAVLEKKGTGTNTSSGGNIFDSTATIRNTSTGIFQMAGTLSDTFYGSATFIQTGSGALQPCYTLNGIFYKNLSTSGTSTAITFGANTGTVFFLGNYTKYLDGSSSRIPVIRRLTMNSDSNLILNVPLTVNVNLTLTKGKISTSNTNILTLASTGTTTSGSATSYVAGPLIRTMASIGPLALEFPIGTDSAWQPAILTPTHSNTTSVTYRAAVIDSSAALLGFTNPITIHNVSTLRYWKFDRQNVANFSNGTLQLYYFNNDSVSDPSNLRIVKNNNPISGQWYDIGGTGTSAPSGTITSNGTPTVFNTFPSTSSNYFAIGNAVGGANGLPVELVELSAICVDQGIKLKWTTASEVNNEKFRIYTLKDLQWMILDSVSGHGNSKTFNHYDYLHRGTFTESQIYLLEQVDFDGKYERFPLVSATCHSEIEQILIYPNPAHLETYIQLGTQFTYVQVLNSIGEIIETFQNTHPIHINLEYFKPGTYFIRAMSNFESIIRPLIVY